MDVLRKLLWGVVIALSVVYVGHWYQVEIPCEVCGETAHVESYLEHVASGFNCEFIHQECCSEWSGQ